MKINMKAFGIILLVVVTAFPATGQNGKVEQSLRRGSPRAALNQWWTTVPHYRFGLGTTSVGFSPALVQSDGTDLWVPDFSGKVLRVRSSDGRVLETWTGATNALAPLVAMGRVFVTAQFIPGRLYMIDPAQGTGNVTTVADPLGDQPVGIAFDGRRIWTSNFGDGVKPGSVSIVTPGPTIPWSVTTIHTGFNRPWGILYDGSNIWVTDQGDNTLKKLDDEGQVIQSVPVGELPFHPIYDGFNIWVPSAGSNRVTVIKASSGEVLAKLKGNGLNAPAVAAFDGQRVLVTNGPGHSVSLWRASDFSPLGSFSTGPNSNPFGVCSDGINFWIVLQVPNQLARY